MCNRFASPFSLRELMDYYHAGSNGQEYVANYNVAPTDPAPIVIEDAAEREIVLARFGVPMATAPRPLTNIQSEKSANRQDFLTRRCLVPASGFYEWERRSATDKQPYFYSPRREGEPFSFAGLWKPLEGGRYGFMILTTQANALVGRIHGRMPVILGHNAIGAWLSPQTEKSELAELLHPFSEGLMQARTVSKTVNNTRNKGADCLNSA